MILGINLGSQLHFFFIIIVRPVKTQIKPKVESSLEDLGSQQQQQKNLLRVLMSRPAQVRPVTIMNFSWMTFAT